MLEKFEEAKYFLEDSVYYKENFVKILLKFIDGEKYNQCYIDIKDVEELFSFNEKIAKIIGFILLDNKYHITKDIKEEIIKKLRKCSLSRKETSILEYHYGIIQFFQSQYKDAIKTFNKVDEKSQK